MKTKYFLLLLIIFYSCKDDISNGKFRNENYVFYQENGKEGEWRKINPELKTKLPKSFSTYFFPNGNRYAELEVLDSFPNRTITWYDKEDKLSKTEWYINDTLTKKEYRDGYVKLYHSSLGILSHEGEVFDNMEQGEWKRYTENGTLLKKYNLKDGKDHGKRIDYYTNGKIESISNWENHMQAGLAQYYYENGNIKEVNSVKNKKLHGESIEYYESGQIESHEFFWNGKRTDTCKYYFKNGQLRILQIFNLDTVKMKSNGKQINYYPNGELEAKAIFDGKYANMTLYYENGIIKQVSEKFNNKHHGKAIAYHKNGRKRLEGIFIENMYNGFFKFYSESGKLIKTVNYDYNEPIDSIMH